MKKIFFTTLTCLGFLFPGHVLYAQTDTTHSLYEHRKMFAPLNTALLRTGILYERSAPELDFSIYRSGASKVDDPPDWDQLYLQLVNSAYTNTLPAPDSIFARCRKYFRQRLNPLMILCFAYEKISPAAIDSNLLDTSGGQYFDVAGRNRSPYTMDTVIAVCPAFPSFGDSTVSFILAPDLFFSNLGNPSSVLVDFSDGNGFTQVSPGSIIRINYSSYSSNSIKVKLQYGNGVQLSGNTAYRKFRVPGQERLNKTSGLFEEDLVPAWLEDQEYGYNGIKQAGLVTVAFGHTNGVKNTCLTKPLLIVEGIDFGYNTRWDGCYMGKCGSLGFIDFLTGMDNDLSNGTAKPFPPFTKAPVFIQQMNNLGYDVMYLDFQDGSTFMQENAMLLVTLLEKINSHKCSNEETVIIGASMGGQISRYALSWMEKNNIPHCTRLYVSFDSPHQGANIPLGAQHYLDYFSDKSIMALDNLHRKIWQPATRQLLRYHYQTNSRYYEDPHPYRVQFLSELAALGSYPQHLRRVTIANGSCNAYTQRFGHGDKLVQYHWNWGIVNIDADIWAAPGEATGKPGYPYRIAYMDRPGKKPFTVTVHWDMPHIDNAPGGFTDALRSFGGKMDHGVATVYHPFTSFIPSTSALDIQNTNDLFYNISSQVPAGSPDKSKYPFEAYYAPSDQNQVHVLIDINGVNGSGTGNADWTIRQVLDNANDVKQVLTITYNFGLYERRFLNDVKISGGGRLHVNGAFNLRYGTVPAPVPGSTFELATANCPPVVEILNEGKMILGDKNGNNNNKAIVRFGKGSRLIIHNNGTLLINNGSKLVLEEGAELVYHAGAGILLDGPEAVLELNGKVTVKDGAVFTFTQSAGLQGGYIRISVKSNQTNTILAEGSSAQVHLTGSGCNDKIIEMAGGNLAFAHSKTDPANYFSFIRIGPGKIAYTAGASSLIIGSAGLLDNLLFKSGNGIPGTQLYTRGQNGLVISNCTFEDFGVAIDAIQSDYNDMLRLENCRFFRGNTGITVTEGGFSINNCIFKGYSGTGIFSQANRESSISNSYIDGGLSGTTGIVHYPGNKAGLAIKNCQVSSNYTGIDIHSGPLTMRCCVISNNQEGVNLSDTAELNLCPGILINGQGGKNCAFINNNTGIVLDRARLYLRNGNNRFIKAAGAGSRFISGSLLPGTAYLSGNQLDVSGNYWNPALPPVLSPAYYNITIPQAWGMHPADVLLAGLHLASYTSNCQPLALLTYVCQNTFKNNPVVYINAQEEIPEQEELIPADETGIRIYPNPASTNLYLSGVKGSCFIQLINATGQAVFSRNYDAGQLAAGLDISALPEGLYIARITASETMNCSLIIRR